MFASKVRKKIGRGVIYILVFFVISSVLLPYLWLIYSSLCSKIDLVEVPFRFTKNLTLDNYKSIFLQSSTSTTDAASQFKYAMRNSGIVSLTVTLFSLVIGVTAAYAFTRMKFKGKKPLFYMCLSTQMIPPVALIIPFYIIILNLKLIDSLWSLILINLSLALPFVLWIMRGYLSSIPVDLEDAARIDGCSYIQAFWRIILPVSAPGLAATTVFAFITSWNEFFYAVNIALTTASKTMPVAISEFSSKFGFDFVMSSTAGVLASIPPVVLSLIFQKYIISGMTAGSVKG